MNPGDSISGKVRILIDMDGVLCDWEPHFLAHYKKMWPDRPFIPLENRRAFLVRNDYKDQLGITNPNEVYEQKGWFLDLPPVKGAVETFNVSFLYSILFDTV